MECSDLLFLALDELEGQEDKLESSSYWDENGPVSVAIATTDPEITKKLWNFLEKLQADERSSSNG